MHVLVDLGGLLRKVQVVPVYEVLHDKIEETEGRDEWTDDGVDQDEEHPVVVVAEHAFERGVPRLWLLVVPVHVGAVLSQPEVVVVVSLVRDEPEEVETREQRRGKVDVLSDGLLEVVPLIQR